MGPGLLESAYKKALVFELSRNGYKAEVQKSISINYEGITIDEGYRADIVVNDIVLIELKSVKQIEDIHLKQLLTYIRLSNKKLGLLINYNEILLKNGIRRVINGTI